MRVTADSHAIVWHIQGSDRRSSVAANALIEAESTDGVIVSVATLIDLWYVAQTTKKLTDADLVGLRNLLASSPTLTLRSVDAEVVDATTAIPRDALTDPWDRFIVGTARTEAVPLVTRDRAIRDSGLVQTIW